jgi:hypothetical protein
VLNPGKYLPSSCTLPQGLACVEFKVDGTANSVILIIRNGKGEDLNTMSIETCGATLEDQSLADGKEKLFEIGPCSPPLTGSNFKDEIIITYESEDGFEHTIRGSISTKIE